MVRNVAIMWGVVPRPDFDHQRIGSPNRRNMGVWEFAAVTVKFTDNPWFSTSSTVPEKENGRPECGAPFFVLRLCSASNLPALGR